MANTNLPARLLDTSAVPALNVTGDLTVDTTTLKVDSTNNRVGIGSASPSQTLQVNPSAGGYNLFFGRGNSVPGSSDPWLGLFNAATIGPSTYGWGFYDSNSDGSFQIWNRNNSTTGAVALTIKRGGNVGIGHDSPSAGLDVVTNSTVWAGEFTQSNTSNGDGLIVTIGSTNSADYALSVRSDEGNKHILAAKANGRVGVGTATPRYDFAVQGDNATAMGIALDNANGSGTADLAVLGSNYTSHQAGPGEVWLYSPDHINIGGATGQQGNVKFLSNNAVNMIVRGDGTGVGIGTTSPRGLLEINKVVTGANDQEMLTISRDGGATSDGARQASIAFFDGDNNTYTGKISGYRDSPAGNYDGGLRFYVNPHATNANATFAELNNTPALYLNPNRSITTFNSITQDSSAVAGSSGNQALIKPKAGSATTDTTASIAIQQATSEGDTIIFADYDPYVEYGISALNSSDELIFTAGTSSNAVTGRSNRTYYNNAGSTRTAYTKFYFNLHSGDLGLGGDIVPNAGHGINFGNSSPSPNSGASGSSNILDDYEEGTFSPNLPNGGTISTVYAATYTKVGRLVHYNLYIVFSVPNDNGTFAIGGLPYTPNGGGSNYTAATCGYYGSGNLNVAQNPISHASANYLYIHRADGTSATVKNSMMYANGWSGNNSLIISGCFVHA